MKLEYIDKTNFITDGQLMSDLKNVAKKLNKNSVTISEYIQNGRYDPTTIMRHFGTWNNALIKLGLKISNRQYNDQELYDNLANIWIKLGHQPSRRDLLKLSSPISYKAYERRFGKWSNALKNFINYYNQQDSEIENHNQKTSSNKTSRDISLRMRFNVFKRDNYRCCICGASPATNPTIELQCDHIIPYSKGGTNTIDNLQTLCSKCNLGKSNLNEK